MQLVLLTPENKRDGFSEYVLAHFHFEHGDSNAGIRYAGSGEMGS